jgi:hypothetical protein
MLNKIPTTESAYTMQCRASVSSHAINPVAINGLMATQLSHRNSETNAEETQQSNSEQWDDPHTTEMSDLKQKGYVMCEKIGEGSYATVCLAYYTDRTSSETVRRACKILEKEVQPHDMTELEITGRKWRSL